MKKIIALLMATLLMFTVIGCGDSEDSATSSKSTVIEPAINIKGVWTVVSTPDPIQLNNPADYNDTAKIYDMTMRGSINAVFPKDGTIEVFENGVVGCNGLSMNYRYVASDAVEFAAKDSGLIFKLKKDGKTLKLTLNDKYEVVLTEK